MQNTKKVRFFIGKSKIHKSWKNDIRDPRSGKNPNPNQTEKMEKKTEKKEKEKAEKKTEKKEKEKAEKKTEKAEKNYGCMGMDV